MNKRNIRAYFCKEHKIQDKKTLERLSDIAFIKKVKRHDILVKQGEVSQYLLFLLRGIISGYYVDEKGKYHVELLLSGKLNDVPSGRLFRADLGFLQMCQSL